MIDKENNMDINPLEKEAVRIFLSKITMPNSYNEVLKMITENPSLVNSMRSDGTYAIYIAIQNKKTDIVKLLLDNNVRLDVGNGFHKNVHEYLNFFTKGNEEIIKLLENYTHQKKSSQISSKQERKVRLTLIMFITENNAGKTRKNEQLFYLRK